MSRPVISLRHVTMAFPQRDGSPFLALQDVSLDVAEGRFVSIVGPSGCGKSTTLSLIAGLLFPTEGEVWLEGRRVEDVQTSVGFMFQQDALFPWKTVLGNVMAGLLFRQVPRKEAQERAMAWIRRVGLAGFEHHYPYQLSGGMRKRVSLAQTLVYDPDILLMDEPFSALDVQTRDLMENELLALWQELRKTVLFITHDLQEAIALSDEVVVMTAAPGRVKARYPIHLARPRNLLDIRTSPEFEAIYSHIWGDLREEVMASYTRSQ